MNGRKARQKLREHLQIDDEQLTKLLDALRDSLAEGLSEHGKVGVPGIGCISLSHQNIRGFDKYYFHFVVDHQLMKRAIKKRKVSPLRCQLESEAKQRSTKHVRRVALLSAITNAAISLEESDFSDFKPWKFAPLREAIKRINEEMPEYVASRKIPAKEGA